MDIYLKSFNGFTLNNANYRGAVITSKNPPDATMVFVNQAEADAQDAGTFTRGAVSIPIYVSVIGAGRNVLESQLKEALKPGTIGALVVTFTDENRDYQKTCRVVSVMTSTKIPGVYTIVLQSGESAWSAVVDDAETWSLTTSGDTKSLTVGGYSETCLSVEIEPLAAPAGGWAYQRLYQLINKEKINHGIRPWMIEMDTATLVTAGKMQADCDDLLVLVDGQPVKRWIADANTNHTGIWINIKLDTGQSLPLLTPVASSGTITELAFQKTNQVYYALKALPARGYLVHGTEWFEYTATNPSAYKVTISSRGALATTKQAHAANDVFQWVQHPVIIMYGNATATDPADDDLDYDLDKPVFDLSASDNTQWVYTASTLFYDSAYPNRPGSWKPIVFSKLGDVSKIYTASQDVDGAAPAMGLKMGSWIKLGKAAAESAKLLWQFGHPGGIATVTMTGQKYRATATWPGAASAGLMRGTTPLATLGVWADTSPTAAATWESFTHTNVAVIGNMPWINLVFFGSMKAETGSLAYFEVLTATVTFVAANQPAGSLLAEKASFLLDATITNLTNGDSVGVLIPLLLHTYLLINGEDHQVTWDGVNAQSALVIKDRSRDEWIRLEPGANVIQITGTNIAAMTVGLTWKERRI